MPPPPRSPSLRNLLRLIASLGLAVSAAQGQDSWRSSLYPLDWQPPGAAVSFATAKLIQDFSYAGYRRGEVPVPTITGPVFDAVQYGADPTGTTDSTQAIQSAINAAAAAGGGVVFLAAGDFRISPQGTSNQCLRISASNIVLRGTGPTRTFLLNTSYNMNGKAVIQVSPPSSPSTGTAQSITADLPGPTRRIPVGNAGAFNRGNIVRLQWNFTSDWINDNGQQTWWGTSSPGSAIYFREVTATNPAEGWIELDVPTRYWIKTRESPTVRTISGLLNNVAIESLAIGNVQHPESGWGEEDYTDPAKAAYDTHASWLIRFGNVRDSWISDVRSRAAAANTTTCHLLSNGILLGSCLRITVRNCQMRRPQYGGGGGNGYMYRLQNSNECLVRNCVADFSRHGFVISHPGTSGNVFLQCEDRETARATGSSSSGYTTNGSGSDNHQFFSHSNLWDQCHAHNSFYTAHHRAFFGGTPPHGVTSAHAVYWNTSGSGTRYDSSSAPIVRSEQLDYGYVIGTRATSGTAYFASTPTGGNTAPADHLAGVYTGGALVPPSLYLDQAARRIPHTVMFNSNGGPAAVPASLELLFNQPYGPLPAPGRPGFGFAGWFTAPAGGTLVTADTLVSTTADHTLHARWNALPAVTAGPDQSLALNQLLPWSPAAILTAAWYDAADSATLTPATGAVSLWRDKSGNDNHAVQATASRRPASGSAVMGGLNAVSFNPVNDQHLAAPHHASLNPDAAGGLNLFAVFNGSGYVNRGSGLNSIISKGSLLAAGAGYGIRVNVNNQLPFKAADNVLGTPPDPLTSRDLLYSAIRDDTGKTASVFIHGWPRATATGTAFASDNSTALVLGGELTTTRCAAVRLGEFIIVPGALTAGNRQRIEGYLAHKWALAANLPADHPHRTSPPFLTAAMIPLSGAASDPEGDPLTTRWSVVAGPGRVTFADAQARATTATFTEPGTYQLRLTANDGTGSRADDLVIRMNDFTHPDPFVQWARKPQSSFAADSNADQLPDGLAWLLGAESPEPNGANLLPLPGPDHGVPAVSFSYLIPARRGSYSLRLQYSPTLAPDSWTSVGIPDSSGTIGGVAFFITPLPGGRLNHIKVNVPAGPAGRGFVRLSAVVPGP